MRNFYKYAYVLTMVAVLALAQSCRQAEETSSALDIENQTREKLESSTDVNSVQVARRPTQVHMKARKPDKWVKAIKGNALLMETNGLRLTAIDTAVIQSETYSVTSLYDDELPPVPEGMTNMTAAAAGYRLLPSGEHFLPYAELRVEYDPSILPEGYTPDDIYTSYYDTAVLAWVRLERVEVDTVNHEIVSLTTHFTDFINELLKAPEMPETQAFVPTVMTDLEAVSPIDGLPMITPPEANNEGTACLSYPIQIPSGRAGMQPILSVNYSSSGGNGWLGVGWDLSVPAITLDTRWGVPRYDATYETEIYLLSGEQLVVRDDDGDFAPMPHRTNQQTLRYPDNTRFYARSGDAHDSIIRHNELTTTYWWEVVDRNGVTHYYGHYPDTNLNTTDHPTTLKDDHGNVAKWMLAESRDPYGNWVRYYYDEVTEVAPVSGRQIYLEHIEYTGNNESPGNYKVVFFRRDRNPIDIPVSCNLGFKETTGQELCYIQIFLDSGSMNDTNQGNAYYFEKEIKYESNFKTRLKSIYMAPFNNGATKKWCDEGKTPIEGYYASKQDFQYYDAPPTTHLFSNTQYVSDLDDDGVTAFMLTPEYRLADVTSATALGLSHSSNWSVGGTLGVGIGANVFLTTASLGGNFHWSENASESLLTLVDLDGDGLSDKVFVVGGTMYWRKQNPPTDGVMSFDNARPITGPGHFLVENGVTATYGVQAAVAVAGGSGSWSTTTSTTTTYFADVDGDGIVDLVHEGEVYFNRLNEDREPEFVRFSDSAQEETSDSPEHQRTACDGIIFDGKVDDSVACDRIWVVERSTGLLDSVDVAEIVNGYQGDDDHMAVVVPDSLGHYRVVYYEAIIDCSNRNLSGRGAENTESVRVWVAPDSGSVSMTTYVTLVDDTSEDHRVSRHSDGVTYTIQHSSGVSSLDTMLVSTSSTLLDSLYICDSCRGMRFVSQISQIQVHRGDVFFFRLQSGADNQFDNVEDEVFLYYNDTLYNSSQAFVLTDSNYYQIPSGGQYSVELVENNTSGDLDTLLVKKTVRTAEEDSISQSEILQVVVRESSADADWDNTDICAKVQFWGSDIIRDTLTFWTVGKKDIQHPSGCVWGDSTYQSLFGPLYHGWGQFAYHPTDPNRAVIPLNRLIVPRSLRISSMNSHERESFKSCIDSTELVGDGFNASNLEAFERDQETTGDLYNPFSNTTCWVPMEADAEHNRWVAFGSRSSIGRRAMSNSMQKDWYNAAANVSAANSVQLPPTTTYDDAVPPPSSDGTPAKAIIKVNKSENHSSTLGVLRVNVASSEGSCNIQTDYIDMNGDRYPDIVGPGYVQYRQQWGGLGSKKGLAFGVSGLSESLTNSKGVGFGASPVSHNKTISARPAKAKFTLAGDGCDVNGDLSIGWNHASSSWTDVNGDGMPDYVANDGGVRLNIGYSFLAAENWNLDSCYAIHSGMSASSSASGGLSLATNIAQGSIQLGCGLSQSVNRTDHTLIDINGDGMPDLIWRNALEFRQINSLSDIFDPFDSVHVRFNLGNGMWSDIYDMNIKNFNWGESYNESLNVGVTCGMTFFSVLKTTIGINGTPYSSASNRDRMQLVDVNGDGLPDLVTSNSENQMSVRYNLAGKTNLLRKVINFTGSEIYLSYHLSEPDFMQPVRTWLLDTVTTHDPLNPNGGDTSMSVFEYAKPHYSRFERTSFGYETVVTKQIEPNDGGVYRKITRSYHNSNFLTKGRIKRELTSDGNDRKYIEKEYYYDYSFNSGGVVDSCSGSSYCTGERVVTRFYEGSPTQKLTTAESYLYDIYHNVVRYTDEGDTARNDDGLNVDFTYYTGWPYNLIGLRQCYKVYPTGSLSPQRQAQSTFNSQGKQTSIVLGTDSTVAEYSFSYDSIYGNLIQAQQPPNLNNQRMTYDYVYDTIVHTYPVQTTNSHGESTKITYNYRFCKPLSVTDPTGSTMTYVYDCLGRIIDIRSPLNRSTISSLRNFYYTKGCFGYYNFAWYNYHNWNYYDHIEYLGSQMSHPRPYSITEHYDDQGNLITRTVVITDGFGRIIQTKKGLVDGGALSMQVSGRTMVDHFGRTTRQYNPFTVQDTSLALLGTFEPYIDSSSTKTNYDILDRTTAVHQPLGVTTRTHYDILNDTDGRRCFYAQIVDPNGNVTSQYTDYNGNRVQLTDANGHITKMSYDNLGQLITSTDPEGFNTHYSYNILGRMTYRNHPDAGVTRYTYDNAGNLKEEVNPLGQINYDYFYYRPMSKRYSYMTGNDETYSYGTSGTETGRPIRIEDGSGVYKCSYDALGNVVDETRTIALPQNDEVYQFRMLYQYDSWGRMRTMTYPDGEEIMYSYQWGATSMLCMATRTEIAEPISSAFSIIVTDRKTLWNMGIEQQPVTPTTRFTGLPISRAVTLAGL